MGTKESFLQMWGRSIYQNIQFAFIPKLEANDTTIQKNHACNQIGKERNRFWPLPLSKNQRKWCENRNWYSAMWKWPALKRERTCRVMHGEGGARRNPAGEIEMLCRSYQLFYSTPENDFSHQDQEVYDRGSRVDIDSTSLLRPSQCFGHKGYSGGLQ